MKKFTILFTVFIASCLTIKAEESLGQYAARYKFPQGSVISEVNVVFENGVLHLNSSLGTTSLETTGDDKFYMPANSGTVTFLRNEGKKITGIKFAVQNISLEGSKEEKSTDIDVPPVYKSTFPIKNLPAMLAGDGE
ncbi:hypothetical protein [Ferruginibacter profundus]